MNRPEQLYMLQVMSEITSDQRYKHSSCCLSAGVRAVRKVASDSEREVL